METILSLKNLDKKFGRVHAVNNLSFDIQKGNVYGILGPNGSGKSTTLGIILNVVNKTSGNFSWFGGSMTTHQALKKVGAIIERPNFYPYMTAKENLELVCKIKEVPFSNIEEKLSGKQKKIAEETFKESLPFFERALTIKPEEVAVLNMAKEVQEKTNATMEHLRELKEKMVEITGGVEPETGKLIGASDYDKVSTMMIQQGGGKGFLSYHL